MKAYNTTPDRDARSCLFCVSLLPTFAEQEALLFSSAVHINSAKTSLSALKETARNLPQAEKPIVGKILPYQIHSAGNGQPQTNQKLTSAYSKQEGWRDQILSPADSMRQSGSRFRGPHSRDHPDQTARCILEDVELQPVKLPSESWKALRIVTRSREIS